MSPWEGADYVLPGDEKSAPVPPAPHPKPVADANGGVDSKAPETRGGPDVDEVKPTDSAADTGAGARTDAKAAERVAPGRVSSGSPAGQGEADPAPVSTGQDEPGAPEPTENRPARKARKATARDTKAATEPRKRPRKPREDGQ
jgi:NADH-quinone oxidoreductase subunit C